MIGRFTTLKFDSRLDFSQARPYESLTSFNDFTNVGMSWMWRKMAGEATDSLAGAMIGVGDGAAVFTAGEATLAGAQTAMAPLDEGFPVIEGPKITLRATFGERDGAFDWYERGVFTPSGVLLDRAVGDQGRKVMGAIWVVIAELELTRS